MSDIKYVHNFAKHLHNKFKDIVYEDTKHEYYNKRTNTKLISVTQSLKLFEKKFDADYWANKKALQEGITKEEMLLKWDELKKVGIDRGNKYHNYIEKRHNKEIFLEPIPEIEAYFESHNDIPLLSEFVIGNEIIGGRLDHMALRDDYLVLKDWKGNKKFDKESPYKLINGLEHLPNTEYYKYALQVSLYKYILDIDDIKKLEVVWFNNNTFQVFEMPYLYEEVQHINNYVNSRAHSSN